jgi:uncharacterized protein (UPF0548 family)
LLLAGHHEIQVGRGEETFRAGEAGLLQMAHRVVHGHGINGQAHDAVHVSVKVGHLGSLVGARQAFPWPAAIGRENDSNYVAGL